MVLSGMRSHIFAMWPLPFQLGLGIRKPSLESLVLIYADFRVKNQGGHMHIYSLRGFF
jgi:hypothetical protein